MNNGYKHIIIVSYIIYIKKATADLESKYRKLIRVYDWNLHWRNDAVLNTINHAKNQRHIQY